jgi:hypothetical protein
VDSFANGWDKIDLSGIAGETHAISVLGGGVWLLSIDTNHDGKWDMEIQVASATALTDADIFP